MTLIKDKTTGEWKKVCEDYAFSWGFPGLVQQFAGAANKVPPHWLLCDGSEYDVGAYPELFDVIGYTYGGSGNKFKVPDYRECTLVGAGENGTDTMEAHDVYGLGEFKDDQLQNITGRMWTPSRGWTFASLGPGQGEGALQPINQGEPANAPGEGWYGVVSGVSLDASLSARTGITTHGKQKGTNYIIHV